MVDGVSTILARVAPMMPVFHAVVAEPAGEVYRSAEALRRPAMYELATDVLLPKGTPQLGLKPELAGDVLVVLLGPEIYRMFVLELGWTRRQWVDWAAQLIARELFGPG